jgi:hypothetical protein
MIYDFHKTFTLTLKIASSTLMVLIWFANVFMYFSFCSQVSTHAKTQKLYINGVLTFSAKAGYVLVILKNCRIQIC